MVYKGRGRREDFTECAIAQVNKMNPVGADLVVSISLQLACFHWKNEIQLQACNHLLDYHIFRV